MYAMLTNLKPALERQQHQQLVLLLAELNLKKNKIPWSRKYFLDNKINNFQGDLTDALAKQSFAETNTHLQSTTMTFHMWPVLQQHNMMGLRLSDPRDHLKMIHTFVMACRDLAVC